MDKIYFQIPIYKNGQTYNLIIRNYSTNDIEQLIDIQRECFPPPFPSELWWNREQLISHIETFPLGAICAEINNKLVGSMTSLIINYKPSSPDHTWEEVTDNGYIRNAHRPDGNTLYIVDISVRPDYRFLSIGKHLMLAMYYIVVHLHLDRLLGCGRMPGYAAYAGELSPEQYVDKVIAGKLKDRVISFLLKCGRKVVKVIPNYLDDQESSNNGVLMEWKNPFK